MKSVLAYIRVAISLPAMESNLSAEIERQMRGEAEMAVRQGYGQALYVLEWLSFRQIASIVHSFVTNNIERWQLNDDDAAELFQELALKLTERSIISKAVRSSGPRQFLIMTIRQMTLAFVQDLNRQREREYPVPIPEGVDPNDPLSLLVEKDLREAMRSYVLGRMDNRPGAEMLFDTWMDGLERYGSRLNVRLHVLPYVTDKTGIPEKTLYGHMGEMKKLMLDFFRSEGIRVSPNVFSSEGMRVEDRVAYWEIRRRMAQWVLLL